MIKKFFALSLAFSCFAFWVSANSSRAFQSAPIKALSSFAEPALSPNHSEIAFASGGDIWTVPVDGGEARLLISHPANDSRPLYSPDGKRLAFISTRSGNGDIYLLTFDTGE